MKRILIFLVLIVTSNLYAESGFSYFWTPVARDTVTAAKLKANYDTVRLWAGRLADTLNNNKVPWSGAKFHDSTFKYMRIDSIRNSPDIDTISNVRWIGGAPDIDTISNVRRIGGAPKIDTIRGPTFLDTVTISKISGLTYSTSGFTSNGRDTISYLDTSFTIQLYNMDTLITSGTARIVKIGRMVHFYVPELYGTINTVANIRGLPSKFTTGMGSAYGIPTVLVSNGYRSIGFFQPSNGYLRDKDDALWIGNIAGIHQTEMTWTLP